MPIVVTYKRLGPNGHVTEDRSMFSTATSALRYVANWNLGDQWKYVIIDVRPATFDELDKPNKHRFAFREFS